MTVQTLELYSPIKIRWHGADNSREDCDLEPSNQNSWNEWRDRQRCRTIVMNSIVFSGLYTKSICDLYVALAPFSTRKPLLIFIALNIWLYIFAEELQRFSRYSKGWSNLFLPLYSFFITFLFAYISKLTYEVNIKVKRRPVFSVILLVMNKYWHINLELRYRITQLLGT